VPFSRRSFRPTAVAVRARLLAGAIASSVLALVACLDDSPTAPDLPGISLRIAAQIGGGEGDWTVAIRVYYYRENESQVDLPIDPDTVYLDADESVDQPVSVDITRCLADPERADFEAEVETAGCRLYVELQLIDDDGEVLSEETNDALASEPGEIVEVPPFVLPPGEIAVQRTVAAFTAPDASDPPPDQSIAVASSTSQELGTLSSSIDYLSGTNWLQASIEQSEGSAVNLAVTTTGLAPGVYEATVTISSSRQHVPATIAVTYTVTPRDKRVTISGAGNGDGSVTLAGSEASCVSLAGQVSGGCTHTARHGNQLTLNANPRSGSAFAGWSGACTGTGQCVLTMDQDRAVTATFTLLPRRLTVSLVGTGAGAVTSSPAGITCSRATGQGAVTCGHDFLHLTQVTLTAVASQSSAFIGWSGGGCAGTAPCTLTMDQARTVTATFNIAVHKLTVLGSGTGSGVVTSKPTGIECRIIGGRTESPCEADFPIGSSVTLTATPDEGHSFDGWEDHDCGRSCTVILDKPRTITAVFLGPPPPGRDIVVFNDVNVFDDQAMGDPNTNNVRLVQNLVNYSVDGPRNAGRTVQIDCGRQAAGQNFCSLTTLNVMIRTIETAGFTVERISSTAGTLTSFHPGVKVLFLVLGCQAFTSSEVNAMKRFADEGGRVIFVGEFATSVWGPCIPVENQFLKDMGAVMTNVGNEWECGHTILPATSLRAHQITTGVNQVTVACSSEITLGPNDFALYLDRLNAHVLAGVARIDVTPLPIVAGAAGTAATALVPHIPALAREARDFSGRLIPRQ
jgi:hypothetical protein